jgi:acyl dehydratase
MHLTIVDGPSGHGVYTLRLASPASEADRDALVASLLSNADVRFAQPVTIGATQ